MNERYIFAIAALVAEALTSIFFGTLSPDSPLCAAFPYLPNYAGQHAFFSFILWILILSGSWVYYGPQLLRARQNLSTKVILLAKLAVVGVIIDNLVSFYLYEDSPEAVVGSASSTAILVGFAVRTVSYISVFSIAVWMGFLVGRNQKQIVTPPPRFGRE